MKSPLTVSIVVFLILGGLFAGLYASRNASSAAATSRSLIASMINPSDTIDSPRTYNQTLVETIDTAALAAALQQAGMPVTAVTFDVLPDSFHIQATAALSEAADGAINSKVATAIASALSTASTKLVHELFAQNTPEPVAAVALTKVLPLEAAIQQSPVAAMLYGAIAGALFGWFIGLTITDRLRASSKA